MKTFTFVENLSPIPDLERRQDEQSGTRQYQLPTGEWVPSVTTLLQYFKRGSLSRWRERVGEEEAKKISTSAARRGTKIHLMLERYLNNDPQYINEQSHPDEQQAFNDLLIHVDKIDNIRYSEAKLYSPKMRLAGQVDVIAEYDGKLSVIDFKTSSKVKEEKYTKDYFLQATAYALMHEDLTGVPIDNLVILVWSMDGGAQVFEKSKAEFIEELFNKIIRYHKENKS